MASKKILFFERMIADAGVEDKNLVNDLMCGFKITGSALFKPKLKPASMSLEELISQLYHEG